MIEMMSLSEDAKQAIEDARRPSCPKCIHMDTCKYVDATAPLFADRELPNGKKKESPIKVIDLALICKRYLPEASVITQ